MKNLDELLDQSKSLADFLGRAETVEKYFELSQNYYGKARFSRESYLEILRQLRLVLTHEPELAKRLWRKHDLSRWSFSVKCQAAMARNVYPTRWRDYLRNWEHALESEFSDEYILADVAGFNQSSKKILKVIGKEQTALLRRIERFSKPAKKKALRSFYLELKKRPEVQKMSAFAVCERLKSTDVQSLLLCEDANLIFNWFQSMRDDPNYLVPAELRDISAPILSSTRDRLPSVQKLKLRTDLFPNQKRTSRKNQETTSLMITSGRYAFEPVERLFHGLFKGIAVRDCVSNLGDRGEVHPARWITGAIEGSVTLHIRKGRHYHGSVSILPIQLSGKTWGLLECSSPLMAAHAVFDSGRGFETELFAEKVLAELARRKDGSHNGICFCGDIDFDNWGVTRSFARLAPFVMSNLVGTSSQATIADALALRICDVLPRGSRSSAFGKGVIHPGKAENLPIVEPDLRSHVTT